jgi:hypothetical protein
MTAVMVGLFGAGAAAEGATYTVIQCHGGYTGAHEFVFGTYFPGTFYGEDDCGHASSLGVRARPHTGAPANWSATWGVTAPDWTAFTGFQGDFQGGWNGSSSVGADVHVCGDYWCTTWKHWIAFGWGGDSAGIPGVPPWGTPGRRSWSGSGGRVIRVGLICAFGDCAISQWGAGVDMFGPRFELDDQAFPDSPGFTAPSGWQRGTISIGYWASDRGSGIRQAHLYTEGGARRATDVRACHTGGGVYTRFQPCPLATEGSLGFDTNALADGTHAVNVLAEDASGQASWGGQRTLLVDNTPPTPPTDLAVVGGEEWRASPDFAVRWRNPTGQHAPLVRAHYTLCRSGGGCAPGGSRTATDPSTLDGVRVPAGGDWLLRVHLEDEAGNLDAQHPSQAAHLRFDGERPDRVEFEPPDPDDPQRIAVAVSDALSGIGGGVIEMRSEGGQWQPLPTLLEGGHLVASVDDSRVAPGFYEFRATARDRAGNERSSTDGPQSRPPRLYLPARIRAQLAVRATRAACPKRAPRSAGRAQRRCRRALVRPGRGFVRLGFRARSVARGRVETLDGVSIANVPVRVLFRHRATDGPFRTIGASTADADGRFAFPLPRGPSGSYRFVYDGSQRFGPALGELRTLVRAAVALRSSKQRARNGQSVAFSGRLLGKPLPAVGRTVDLQAFIPGSGWRTFATPRTGRRGRFAYTYRFRFSTGVQRYRIRALVEQSGDYPYERAASRPVVVTVRGG